VESVESEEMAAIAGSLQKRGGTSPTTGTNKCLERLRIFIE